MENNDVSMIEAKKAYLDEENGHCRLNNLICTDGDCRRCNFVTDGSLMLVLDTVCHELAHIKQLLGDDEGCSGCDCNCDCGEE
jgi:hypothetical protein